MTPGENTVFSLNRNSTSARIALILTLVVSLMSVTPATAQVDGGISVSDTSIVSVQIQTPAYPVPINAEESTLVPFRIAAAESSSGTITDRTYQFFTQYGVAISESFGPFPASIAIDSSGAASWNEPVYLPKEVANGARSSKDYAIVLKSTFNGNLQTGERFTANSSVLLLLPPDAFSKVSPANGAIVPPGNQSLQWNSSVGAVDYEYCFDTIDNDSCDSNWTGTYWLGTYNTNAALQSLPPGTTVYWQVRANNTAGTTYADNGDWWEFTTATTTATSPIYVRWNATGANDGTSWENAYIDLQSALAVASSGTEIWVAAGTYKPTSGTDRTVSFVLKNGVAVYGGFAGTETFLSQRDYQTNVTILSGDIGVTDDINDNSYHVVIGSNTSNSAVLDGFTVTRGNTEQNQPTGLGQGGGMLNLSGSPTVTNVIFTNNYAEFGGGMFNGVLSSGGSSPVLSNVLFSGNHATLYGGGIYNEGNSSPILTNVTMSGNMAVYRGGGMFNIGSSSPILTDVTFRYNQANIGGGMQNSISSHAVLTRVTFEDNQATYGAPNGQAPRGGGIFNSNSNPILTDVVFLRNFGAFGGGISNFQSSPILTNVLFSDNVADLEGGGVHNNQNSNPQLTNVTFSGNTTNEGGGGGGGMLNLSSSPSLLNVTFSNNTAVTAGGAIANAGSNPILTSVILWGNEAASNPEIYNDGSSSPAVTYSVVQGGYTGTGNINANPLLGLLQDNGGFTETMALLDGSPAIDAADNSNCPATDQRGVTRPQGSGCDIGAFESVSQPLPTPTKTPKNQQPTRTPTSTPITPTATHTFTPSATVTSTPVVGVSANFVKSYLPTAIPAGGISLMSVLIHNPNPFALTGAAWTDHLPTGITVANPVNPSNTCGGTVTAVSGGTSLSLIGGTVPALGSCTVTVNVTSNTPGNTTNTIPVGALVTDNGVTNSTPASATLTVIPITVTSSATATRTATVGGKPTKTSTPSRTPSPTRTPTHTLTPTRTNTPTLTPSSTHVTITATWTYTPSPTTTSSFPTTALRDNFNRANGAIGNNWFGYPSAFSIASNQLDVTATGSNTFILWKSSSFGADQEAYVTLAQIDTTPGSEHRLILKSQNSKNVTSGSISVRYDAAAQTVQVWTYHPSQGWVQHGTIISAAFANGDQFGARARPDGTVEVYRNGTLLGTRSITSWPFYNAGGYIGMGFVNAPNALLDNFGGGTR